MNTAEALREKINNNHVGQVKAVIYARVSTDNESQKDSCANQVELAQNFVKGHPSIKLTGIFIDDGISGKNDFTRPEYNAMLQEIVSGNVDLVITKSLSRLNRDELNSLHLKNLLRKHEATVLTLEDGQIHDFEDINSGLLHSISFAVDAQYVQRQSLIGKKTHELRCQRKELTAKDRSYGYDWIRESKTMVINEAEAEIVQEIFEEYVYKNETPSSIERTLKTKGITISGRSISNIIKDERYIGKFYINKKGSRLGTGDTKTKRYNLPRDEWILVSRPDLQIIDIDLFEMAQRVHATRVMVSKAPDAEVLQARFRGTHKYASKVFCSCCGKPYHFGYADRNNTIPVYRINSHPDCPNPNRRIYEEDLDNITRMALVKVISEKNEVCDNLATILEEIVAATKDNGNEIERLQKRKLSKEKSFDKLSEAIYDDRLTDKAKERLIEKINLISEEIEKITVEIEEKENSKLDETYVSDKIKTIRDSIDELKNFTVMDRARILNYIDRIEIDEAGDVTLMLCSGEKKLICKSDNPDFLKPGRQDALYS